MESRGPAPARRQQFLADIQESPLVVSSKAKSHLFWSAGLIVSQFDSILCHFLAVQLWKSN